MNFIGDFFALGLILVLCMFYFDHKYFLTKASRYFVACLLLTAATAATDLITGILLSMDGIPLWINLAANSLYFVVNIITTSSIALFLFTKILEHSYDTHCMTYARRGLYILFSIYMIFVLANLKTGWMFWFDGNGQYQRGPLNALGYLVTLCQMGLVVICYCRNYRNANKAMKRALLQTFPVIVLCIIIQRLYPEIMLNGFIMSMVDTVLFLTFQGQRQGVHSLTKLNDRHRFFRDLELRNAAGEPFQIFLINIRNFGSINQKYGHMLGDEVLYQFAFALERLIKNSMAFHMNGTIFAVIIPYTSNSAADGHRARLQEFLESGVDCAGERISLDFIAADYRSPDCMPESMPESTPKNMPESMPESTPKNMPESMPEERGADASELYELMEFAVSEAYRQNRNWIRCTPEMKERMRRRQYLIDRLRTVDRQHGFQVWYQPIYCLSHSHFCSMEALLRLQEPDGTIISPAEFIPLAEETGMLEPVTWFVLEETCAFLSSCRQLDKVSVSVNLPMSQLLDQGFFAHLNQIVDRYGIPHHRICLEFTERAILENFEKTKGIMNLLTSDGYRFYLDDFGTGYSNFNCLLQLPFQFIKLDACLIGQEENGKSSYQLIRTLTSLFHDMQLHVIAEGAETEEEAATLQAQGVDRIQGYFYARPMPPQQLLAFYAQHPVE